MKSGLRTLLVTTTVLAFGHLNVGLGQDSDTEPTIENRLLRLERSVATLDSQLQLRTTTSGPADRTTRDFNLETRLNEIERRVQQLANDVAFLQRQVADANRIANQAQRDAQMAQQFARDAMNRIR